MRRNEVDFSKKKRIVVKVGSSTITHNETGLVDYIKLERLVRQLCDMKNRGMDVVLVTSGAIAVGRGVLGIKEKPSELSVKQACASIGQASLMSIYQKLFAEYSHVAGQILITKYTMILDKSRHNARNTFMEMFSMGAIPVVNENDTISTHEIQFGDNDTLSAIVAALVGADALVLLSDIEGLYTGNPRTNPNAELIDYVECIDDVLQFASDETGSAVGTGGMSTKLRAAQIASDCGADMAIISGDNIGNLHKLLENEHIGTVFKAHPKEEVHIIDFLKEIED